MMPVMIECYVKHLAKHMFKWHSLLTLHVKKKYVEKILRKTTWKFAKRKAAAQHVNSLGC